MIEIVVCYGRNNFGCVVGWSCDYLFVGGVFFVDGYSVDIQLVDDIVFKGWIVVFFVDQFLINVGGVVFDFQFVGQNVGLIDVVVDVGIYC